MVDKKQNKKSYLSIFVLISVLCFPHISLAESQNVERRATVPPNNNLKSRDASDRSLRVSTGSICVLSFPNVKLRKEALTKLSSSGFTSSTNESDDGKEFKAQVWNSSLQQKEIEKILLPIVTDSKGKIISCEAQTPETQVIARKPVIYLYPLQPQEVMVQLDYQGQLVTTYPDYDPKIHGWRIVAYPDGHLINLKDHQEYSYLFWEGIPSTPIPWDLSTGFVVPGSDTKSFLQKTLSSMGLTPKEYNEFIVYWLPRMQKNPYNLIHFAGEEYSETAPLKITPEPDSLLRIFMVFESLANPIQVKPQKLETFERKGFTVVEWGGSEENRTIE